MDSKYNPNLFDVNGELPLAIAVNQTQTPEIQYLIAFILIKNGADPNMPQTSKNCKYPIQVVVNNFKDVVISEDISDNFGDVLDNFGDVVVIFKDIFDNFEVVVDNIEFTNLPDSTSNVNPEQQNLLVL